MYYLVLLVTYICASLEPSGMHVCHLTVHDYAAVIAIPLSGFVLNWQCNKAWSNQASESKSFTSTFDAEFSLSGSVVVVHRLHGGGALYSLLVLYRRPGFNCVV